MKVLETRALLVVGAVVLLAALFSVMPGIASLSTVTTKSEVNTSQFVGVPTSTSGASPNHPDYATIRSLSIRTGISGPTTVAPTFMMSIYASSGIKTIVVYIDRQLVMNSSLQQPADLSGKINEFGVRITHTTIPIVLGTTYNVSLNIAFADGNRFSKNTYVTAQLPSAPNVKLQQTSLSTNSFGGVTFSGILIVNSSSPISGVQLFLDGRNEINDSYAGYDNGMTLYAIQLKYSLGNAVPRIVANTQYNLMVLVTFSDASAASSQSLVTAG